MKAFAMRVQKEWFELVWNERVYKIKKLLSKLSRVGDIVMFDTCAIWESTSNSV